MDAENMSRNLEELALENRPKTYRITVEAIGPEATVLNDGKPYVMETDGFFILGYSQDEDDERINSLIKSAVHHITPIGIAKGLLGCSRADDILSAVAFERMKKTFEAKGARGGQDEQAE